MLILASDLRERGCSCGVIIDVSRRRMGHLESGNSESFHMHVAITLSRKGMISEGSLFLHQNVFECWFVYALTYKPNKPTTLATPVLTPFLVIWRLISDKEMQEDSTDPTDYPASEPALRNLDESLRCPICKDTMRAPVLLTGCGHSFCSQVSAPKTLPNLVYP